MIEKRGRQGARLRDRHTDGRTREREGERERERERERENLVEVGDLTALPSW